MKIDAHFLGGGDTVLRLEKNVGYCTQTIEIARGKTVEKTKELAVNRLKKLLAEVAKVKQPDWLL